jgi:26S proteasome regulatory subunit T1
VQEQVAIMIFFINLSLVANRTDATFIRVIGSELVQKYVGEGARMVRELFEMARTKKACIIFFDEIDAIGGARFDDGAGGDNEVQRTMLELINQLDGFDPRGNIKVLMATNRYNLIWKKSNLI